MTKTFLFSVISLLMFGGANAALPWWEQATICRLNPSTCYTNMTGAGYFYDVSDSDSWDITSNCWGKKYICPEALKTSNTTEPAVMGIREIADTNRVSADFDTTILNGDCFGVRKTTAGGARASVNGRYVNVWCNGILDLTLPHPYGVDETLPNGEIAYNAEPTCSALAENGYVGIQNGKCFGKKYNTDDYFIKCDSDVPTLIILNGANPDNDSGTGIVTKADADARLTTMYNNAKMQHAAHFSD